MYEGLALARRRAPSERVRSVAIVDRDKGFIVVLAKRLEQIGWEHAVLSARAAAAKAAEDAVDAVIVDPAVVGSRPWRWLERVCNASPRLGVIVCAGPSTVAERVRALRLGVDDWVGKPCHPEELVARVATITAQRERSAPRRVVPAKLGEVEIRFDQCQVSVAEENLRLTRREFQLLELLVRADGEVLPRELIYEHLWGFQMPRNDRSVDVFVHKLRRKLEVASPDWQYVHTEFRVGYRLVAEPIDWGSAAATAAAA